MLRIIAHTRMVEVLNLVIIILCVLCPSDVKANEDYIQDGYYEKSVEVNMCGEENQDGLSNEYCTCNEEVISCDFSTYPTGDKPVHMHLVSSWETDLVKRICICGAPKNLEVLFSSKFLWDHHSINRVDIYQMEGPITVAAAFDINFSGDLYISMVKNLREIMSWGFGRGVEIDFVDVEYLYCCSNISTPKLNSPAFFMEESTVGIVRNSGINDQHLWKSIVFNNVVFNEMEEYAISLDAKAALNVSFTNCKFKNLKDHSIAINGNANVLLAKNIFMKNCSRLAIKSTRMDAESTEVALIDNIYLNERVCLELDRKFVKIWFNQFNRWDNLTFNRLNLMDSEISINYNVVESIRGAGFTEGFPFNAHYGAGTSEFAFEGNSLGVCSCSNTTTNIREFEKNSCQIPGGDCRINLEVLHTECGKTNGKLGFGNICSRHEIKHQRPEIPAFKSSFISEMVRRYASRPFQIPQLKIGEAINSAATASSEETLGSLIKKFVLDSVSLVKYFFL